MPALVVSGRRLEKADGVLLITADHGNVELMKDQQTGAPHTAHTLLEVPIIVVNAKAPGFTLRDGRLADVAPTLLDLVGMAKPSTMTGQSLLEAEMGTPQGAGIGS